MQIKKKIIFTVTNDLTYDQRMQRICSSIANAGFEVELVGRKLSNSIEINSTFNYKQTRLSCFFNKGKFFYLEYNIRLLIYLITQKFDAVCSIDFDTLLAGGIASKILGTKLIFDAHEHFTEVPEVTNRKYTKYIWHKIGKIFVPKANLCYTVGPELAKLLGGIYNNHFEVILNVPTSNKIEIDKTVNFEFDEPYILYQGALNKSRGLEQSIKAMHQIENILLVIAGEGDLSQQLKDLVIKEKLNHKVKFLGYIKPNVLKILTAQSKIGLNLLEHDGESYYYSLANKYFDYLQAGVPCLCANFPEYIAINKKYNCSILIDCNENLIAKAINQILSNDLEYDLLKKNALAASKFYNWSIEEPKLIELYQAIL